MKTIAFVNLKGGSGKTTSCLSVGSFLALRDHPTLMIDMDPQGSLTMNAGVEEVDVGTRGLLEGAGIADAVQASDQEMLDIVGANRALTAMEDRSPAALAETIQEEKGVAEGHYDYLLIDPPPHAGGFVLATLMSTDETIIPVQAGRGALEGLNDTSQLIRQIGAVPPSGTFVCDVDVRTIHDKETVEYVKEQYGDLAFESYIRSTVSVREAEMAKVPLPLYDDNSTAAQDYSNLTTEIINRYE